MAALSLRSQRPPARIGITPLIDVVFILMIFFMVASTFTQDREIALDGRQAVHGAAQAKMRILLVRASGLAFEGEEMTAEAIRAHLASTPDIAVAVKPEAGVTVQQMIDAMDMARGAGVRRVLLVR